MPHAHYQQTNFLGGEWSKSYQGRTDNKAYRTGMNRCYNGYPIEAGAWVRRPGTRFMGPTHKGLPAKVYPLYFSETEPYTMEFTDSTLRFFYGSYPVVTEELQATASIDTSNPAILTLQNAVAWSAGDEIAFIFTGGDFTMGRLIRNRVFLITPVAETYTAWSNATTYGNGSLVSFSGTNYVSIQGSNLNHQPDVSTAYWTALAAGATRKYSLQDAVTGANVDGSNANVHITPLFNLYAMRALKIATPYTAGSWSTVRMAQKEDVAILFNGTKLPQSIVLEPNITFPQAATASISPVIFEDGPYLDYVTSSVATLGGTSGSVSCTITFPTWVNTTTYKVGDFVFFGAFAYESLQNSNTGNSPATGGTAFWKQYDKGVAVTGPNVDFVGFQATDVGRLMRFFSTPLAWAAGSGYTLGNTVYYHDVAYQALKGSLGVQPDTDPLSWTIIPSGQNWTWGQITAVGTTNTCTVQIMGDPALYSNPCLDWRLGVYSDTTGYPTCGIFAKGRMWFGGALPNRFDASETNGVDRDGVIRMSPTSSDGTVLDTSAIGYYMEADDQNPVYWFQHDAKGILAGTAGGEWLISASTLNDPLTPFSVDANKVSKYRCADIEPRKAPIATIFVQKYRRKIMEFLADVWTQRYTAPNLSEAAKHMTADGIAEIAYQEELAPIVWARTSTYKLIGATYRRISAFTTEAPAFVGWHQHALGSGRNIESIANGPNTDGSLDALTMVTNMPTSTIHNYNVRFVEVMTQMYDETDSIYNAWFVDGGIIPDQMGADTVGGVAGQRFTGLYYYIGQQVTVFGGGLDLGDYTVDTDGTVFVPFGTGTLPANVDYTSAAAGQPLFTAAYINSVIAMNLVLRYGGVLTAAGISLTTKTIVNSPNAGHSKITRLKPSAITPSSTMAIADWKSNKIIETDGNNFSVINMSTDVEVATGVIATIVGAGATCQQAFCVDAEANIYFQSSGLSNYDPLAKVTEAMALVYNAGVQSTFGPPGSQGMIGGASLTCIEANLPWIVGLGNGICLNRGDTGLFLGGNGSTDPAYEGLWQAQWTRVGSLSDTHMCSAGQPIVMSGYLLAAGYICWGDTTSNGQLQIYFIGVTDGAPAAGNYLINNGSTGKKGKGKKGASDGGVWHTPTTQNPVFGYTQIGIITGAMIDSRYTKIATYQTMCVDQYDNSVLVTVQMDTAHLVNYQGVYSGATTYAAGQIVQGSDSNYYQALVSGLVAVNPVTDTASTPFPHISVHWTQVPVNYAVKYTTGPYGILSTEGIGIAWTVPLITTPNSSYRHTKSQVKGGMWGIILPKDTSNSRIYMIDTTTGKYFAALIPGVWFPGENMWDDQSQSVVFLGVYDQRPPPTGIPTAINDTPTNGADNATFRWYRLWLGTDLGADPAITSTLTQQPNTYTFIYGSPTSATGFPCVVGFNYLSEAQILRPIAEDEAGARAGPAFGATRRSHKLVLLLGQTLSLLIGTDLVNSKGMVRAPLKDDQTGLVPYPTTPYTGLYRDTLEDAYGFDSMPAWRVNRPYPGTIVSVGAAIRTEDSL